MDIQLVGVEQAAERELHILGDIDCQPALDDKPAP
jgi:hypothetical protein